MNHPLRLIFFFHSIAWYDDRNFKEGGRSHGYVSLVLLAPGGKGHSAPEIKGQFWPDEKGQTRLR